MSFKRVSVSLQQHRYNDILIRHNDINGVSL